MSGLAKTCCFKLFSTCSSDLKSETRNAIKYVEVRGVVSNVVVVVPSVLTKNYSVKITKRKKKSSAIIFLSIYFAFDFPGIFDMALYFDPCVILMVNFALSDGSS